MSVLPPSVLRPPPSDVCGPPCIRCGCAETKVLKEPAENEWFPSGRARCRCCGQEFGFGRAEEEEENKPEGGGRRAEGGRGEKIQEVPVRCPCCNSMNNAVTGTKGRLRSRRCGDCGATFQSIRPER